MRGFVIWNNLKHSGLRYKFREIFKYQNRDKILVALQESGQEWLKWSKQYLKQKFFAMSSNTRLITGLFLNRKKTKRWNLKSTWFNLLYCNFYFTVKNIFLNNCPEFLGYDYIQALSSTVWKKMIEWLEKTIHRNRVKRNTITSPSVKLNLSHSNKNN